MSFRYSVLGAGRQGIAIAYDLALNGDAESVTLADSEGGRSQDAAQRINLTVGRPVVSAATLQAENKSDVRRIIRGSHAVVSALPYFLNLDTAQTVLEEKAHFSDLGGNTDIVLEELKLSPVAESAGVSCLPDCGLAPGLSNLLAARAIEVLGKPTYIKARCGGLPQIPRPPFDYKLVFSLEGLINEYSGDAIFLRKGKITSVPALTELETIDIPGVGEFEAAVTTGGTSTAPYSFEGKTQNFDYKTLRYPGHFAAFKGFSDLGLFKKGPARDFFLKQLEPLIDFQADRDMVVLWVEAEGKIKGKKKKFTALLTDKGEPRTSFTAMERTTGFPTAVIAHMQAEGLIPPGAHSIENAIPLTEFFKRLAKRGVKIKETVR